MITLTAYLTRGMNEWHNRFQLYEVTGPDGSNYTENSIIRLRETLKKKYGSVTVNVKPTKVIQDNARWGL